VSLKGIAIWILGFFSFLAGANVINAVIMWFNLGPEGTFTPYLLGGVTGAIPVYAYFLISVLVTLAFFGVTAHAVVSELSVGDQIRTINEKASNLQAGQESQRNVLEGVQARVFLVDESLERARNEFSRQIVEQGNAIKQSSEIGHQTQQKTLNGVEGRVFLLDESLKGVKKGLSEQAEVIKGVNTDLVEKVCPQLAGVKEDLAQFEQRDKKNEAAHSKQRDEIKEIRLKLEMLEGALVTPKSLLTSQSNVEDVKGIGPGKGAELKEIGITNAGDLIMADPKTVAEKTGSSENTVGRWQGRAQLSLVPGLKDKDLLLLEELDIIDRKSLASQDPIELGKKINAIFKVNLAKGKVSETDKPTIEEIDSWVKFVKS
jgi:hypothetical protein